MSIARDGEMEYASIYRRRSGMDAGRIDYGIDVEAVERLSWDDKAELYRVATHLVEALKKYKR